MPDCPTVGLCVLAYGPPHDNPYAQFVPQWWDAVLHMQPAVAQVVIAHTVPDPLGLTNIPAHCNIRVTAVPCAGSHAAMFNAAVSVCDTDWVMGLGVDDIPYPHCLEDLAAAHNDQADVLVGIQDQPPRRTWRGEWSVERLKRCNLLPGSSVFRKAVWEEVGGFPDVYWEDWGFWLRLARRGIKPYFARRSTVLFDVGRQHSTRSGDALDPAIRQRADDEIAQLVSRLWS